MRYFASSCVKVTTEKSTSGSSLGTFSFSRRSVEVGTDHVPKARRGQSDPPFLCYRMHGIYGRLPSWRNPAKHPTSPHGSMAAGDCSDAAVQGLCAGRGMVEARGRSCWGTAGAHRSKQRSYVRLRRNTGPKATRHPAWECWRTGKLKSRESPFTTKVHTMNYSPLAGGF